MLLLVLMSTVFQVTPIRAGTVDISVKAVVGYPLIENLPEAGTPLHNIWFGVGLLNEGTEDTYVNVTIYLNMTEEFFVSNFFLAVGEFKAVVYSTTTSDLGKEAYSISALAVAAGDVNSSDNFKVGDTIKIGMVADTNYDGKVDIKDVAAVNSRYGMTGATINPIWIPEVDYNFDNKIDIRDLAHYSKIGDYYNLTRCLIAFGSSGPHGSPEWDWACDLYRDGKIDIRDVAIASKHFGEVDP